MSIAGKLVIAVAIGVALSVVAALLVTGKTFDPVLASLFILATAATALGTHWPLARPAATATRTPAADRSTPREAPRRRTGAPKSAASGGKAKAASGGPREQGSVKWFNAAKGFGFVTLDDGREIFVHFRSIRGEGRRSLRDGQRVEFAVNDTEKGPQAEDVEALD